MKDEMMVEWTVCKWVVVLVATRAAMLVVN